VVQRKRNIHKVYELRPSLLDRWLPKTNTSPCLRHMLQSQGFVVAPSKATSRKQETGHRSMPQVTTNGINFEYEEIGDKGAPPLLLIMGLGAQMIRWPDAFRQALADEGFRVVCFDNRDVGLSHKFDDAQRLDMPAIMKDLASGKTPDVPYTLHDLALDTVGVMEALSISPAHIVGASMGGMVAQLVAANHGAHVRSLTSIMSSTLDRDLPKPTPEAMAALTGSPASTSREDIVAHGLKTNKVIGSPDYPTPDEYLNERNGLSYDRCYNPAGFMRQYAAVQATSSIRPMLANVTCPTLVIHGRADPLVPVACGMDTAKHVPHSESEIIDGMGHDLPPGLQTRIVKRISNFIEGSMAGRKSA
jgi:pimeloyl-ACP methyl ester carboxylesterase